MSYLRFAAPGLPVRLVDEGPAPHVSLHFRVSGALVSPMAIHRKPGQTITIQTNAERARVRRRTEAARVQRRELAGDPRPNTERCGVVMRVTHEPCARVKGHNYDHRSRYAMDNAARHRRTFRPLGGIR